MVRVTDLDVSLDFYCNKLGLKEVRRIDREEGRYSLVFLGANDNPESQVELTYNWDPNLTTAAATSATLPTKWTTSMTRASA